MMSDVIQVVVRWEFVKYMLVGLFLTDSGEDSVTIAAIWSGWYHCSYMVRLEVLDVHPGPAGVMAIIVMII
jgi:hypothetical protein